MFDQNLMFSDSQSITQAAGSYTSTFSIDTRVKGTPALGGPLDHDWGKIHSQLQILLIVTEAVTSGGAATVQVQIVQADDAALTTNLEVLRETRALAKAVFTLGGVGRLGGIPSMSRRYLGLQYVIGTAATTAGKATAGLTKDVPSNSASLIL